MSRDGDGSVVTKGKRRRRVLARGRPRWVSRIARNVGERSRLSQRAYAEYAVDGEVRSFERTS
jgi:hypothetical protein